MRNVVIAGATGVVGRRAVRELRSENHRVIGVTRSAHGRSLLGRLGAGAVEAEVFDQPAMERALTGADTVVADADPPTRAEIDAALAAVVGRNALQPVDEIPADLEPLSRSQRVRSRK